MGVLNQFGANGLGALGGLFILFSFSYLENREQFIFNILGSPQKNTPISTDFIFGSLSDYKWWFVWDACFVWESPDYQKNIYTSQSIFPWQKPIRFVWGGHFLIKNLESRHHLLIPFLRSRRFRRCVCSKAVHQKVLRAIGVFFFNRALANRPTKKTRSCLFSGWKEGTIPHGSKYRMTEQFWWPKKNSACHICLSVQGLGLGRRTVSSVAKVLVENWVEMT